MPVSGGRNRVVLVLQDRASNDYPIWTWLAKILAPDIRLRWFLDGQTAATDLPIVKNDQMAVERDRQGMLAGSITLITRQVDRARQKVADDKLAELALELGTRRNLSEARVDALREDCRRLIGAISSVIELKFALMRTGECRIWYERPVPGWTEKKHHWIASQAYYFLKDIAHDHTHHDPSDDQITPLIPFDPTSTEEGHDDEIAWRRETMWSLSREIERRNREGGLVAQRESLGIVAYAESFQNSLMNHVRDSSAPHGFCKSVEIHDFDFRYLKASVRSSIDVLSTKLTHRVQVTIALLATLISSLALASSFVSTHNASLPRDGGGASIGGLQLGQVGPLLPWIAGHPLYFAIGALLLLSIPVALFLADGPAGLYNRAQRTISQLSRATAGTLKLSPRLQWLVDLGLHVAVTSFAIGATLGVVWFIVQIVAS